MREMKKVYARGQESGRLKQQNEEIEKANQFLKAEHALTQCRAAAAEMSRRAENNSEMERVARNNGDNSSMDLASGKKFAYFESARLVRAAIQLTEDQQRKDVQP
jgi:hypothetical protein